jgi:CubicO group peptidase (beta-lactamase class C family)
MTSSKGEWPAMRRCVTVLVSAAVDALRQVDEWPSEHVSVGVVAEGRTVATRGPLDHELRWASVTKPVTALAVLVAAEEGTVDLDEPAGPPGSTVRHLLAHASGLPFEGREPIAKPGTRRIYSNTGFEVLAEFVESRAEMPFGDYQRRAVLDPLGMKAELRGSAGSHMFGSLDDLLRFALECLAPTVVAPETIAEATSVQFPGLAGVIPEMGRFDPNDWGLGFELRDRKPGHWSGTLPSETTFGHWGGSGTFLWVDPERALALACLTDLDFGDWAKKAWPTLSDAVVAGFTSEAK